MSTAPGTDVAAIQGAPAAGTWTVDPAHSTVGFTVRHLLSKVRGRFEDYSGTLTVVDTPDRSAVEGSAKTASINTSQPDRDKHLRGPDFFDSEKYPEMTFKSTRIASTGERTFKVTGDLSIRGVTKPVTFDAEFLGLITDPWGNTRAAFTGEATINREEWGLTWNQALEAGGMVVGRDVKIEADLQFVQPKA